MKPIETICNYLNDINQKDPMVLKSLINNRVPCNDQIVNHPHAVVGSDNIIGIMGLLNGALEAAGIGKISYTTDGSNIMKFAPYESTHDCPTRMSQSTNSKCPVDREPKPTPAPPPSRPAPQNVYIMEGSQRIYKSNLGDF